MPHTAVESSAAMHRWSSRLAIIVATFAIAIGISITAPAPASAHYAATSSTNVAADANHALWLLVRWEATADLDDYTAYVQARLATARSTATELGLSAPELDAEWGAVSVPKQHVLLSAMSQMGVPYHRRMSRPGHGFDCSGLVLFAYAEAGIDLPRSSRDQIRAATQIDRSQLEPGDLVYYPGHISLYLGDDFVIHSPQPGQEVEVREIFTRSLRFGDAVAVTPQP